MQNDYSKKNLPPFFSSYLLDVFSSLDKFIIRNDSHIEKALFGHLILYHPFVLVFLTKAKLKPTNLKKNYSIK